MASLSMCSRTFRSLFNYNSYFSQAIRTNFEVRHRLRYSTASTAASDQVKPPNIGNAEEVENASKLSEEMSEREKELSAENATLLDKFKDLDDKYKRSLADNENIRTRMRREISDSRQYGIQSFVKDLVDVVDVLGRATESVPKEALEEDNTHLKSLFEGLQVTEAQLQAVLRRHGVSQIDPIGEKFNPNRHEALFEQVDPSKEPGTVGTVTKVGYKLHDRVVRPAMVGVVKKS